MKYSEFKRHLGKASFTINQFAALIHVLPSAVSNYSKKRDVPQPYAVIAVLLGELGDRQLDPKSALLRYGVKELSLTSGTSGKVTQLDFFRESRSTRKK